MNTTEKLKNSPLLVMVHRAMEKKANRGAKEILSDIGGKIKEDHRFWTTPAGAATGLLLSRQLIPKEDRNLFNQGAGTAAGAGAGFVAGGLLNADKPMTDDDFYSQVLESEDYPTSAMIDEMRKRGFDPSIKGISKEEGSDPTSYVAQKARVTQPMFAHLMWYRLKARLAQQQGRDDIYQKAMREANAIEGNIENVGMGPFVNSIVNRLSKKLF
jgi:hypothetical protein